MNKNSDLINFDKDPMILFNKWYEEARLKELNDPNAMNLATLSKDNRLSSRIVLLKYFDIQGFVFYSNNKSTKGIAMNYNPNVALNFYWKSLKKQVRIEGKVTEFSNDKTDSYFDSRPNESKIGAWASKQSSELKNRKDLEEKITIYQEKFRGKNIPRPNHWIGYSVKPVLFEFWKEQPYRLHDRIEYKMKNNEWVIRRLYP